MTELETHQAHRIECLEAEVRMWRQAVKTLTDRILTYPMSIPAVIQRSSRELKQLLESSGVR
jgi:hypothetical protein